MARKELHSSRVVLLTAGCERREDSSGAEEKEVQWLCGDWATFPCCMLPNLSLPVVFSQVKEGIVTQSLSTRKIEMFLNK